MSDALIADRRLHPAAFAIRFIRNAPQFVIGLPAVVGFSSDANTWLLVLMIGLGAAVTMGAALLSWLRFRYGIGAREIVIESGVLQRQRRVIPFDRVQDIDIEQGLLARLFGTVTVRIETGGAGKDEGRLDAVALAEAHRLRDIVRGHGAAGDAAVAAAPDEPLLFAMELPRLLIAGLFNFSLLFLALIGVAIENVQPFLKARGVDLLDVLGIAGAAVGKASVGGILALVALLLLLGIVTGVLRTVARDYGFRLWRASAGLRRRRGLFTRTEIVVPMRRIQLALIRSGLIGRAFGWHRLAYQTLSAVTSGGGHQVAAPFARMGEIMPILVETGHSDLPSPDEYIQVSRRSVARRSLRYAAPLAAAALALSLLRAEALLLLPLAPLLVVAAVLQWKRHRYALTGTALVVSRGLFQQRLWVVPFEKAQTIAVSRTPLQRMLGIASVTVDTAGASLIDYPAIADLDSTAADALGAELLAQFKAARLAQRSTGGYPA